MAGQRATPPTVDAPSARVVAPCPRVVTNPPPSLATTYITTPNAIRQMPLVHQRQTCNNNPFHILSDDKDNNDTVVTSNCSPSAPPTIPPPSIPPVNLLTHQAPRRLLSPLPIPPTTVQPRRLPTSPPPRVQTTQTFIPAITPAAPYSPAHDLHPVPSQKSLEPPFHTKHQTHLLPIVEPDGELDNTPTTGPSNLPQCFTSLISNRTPCNILCQALYHIIDLGFANAPAMSIPWKLTHDQYTGPVIEIVEYCNGVVHPDTKETITHYKKLFKEPLLRDLWLKAISKELHCLVQRCAGITKGTNAIFFLLHSDICNIPRDKTVTYACIVMIIIPKRKTPTVYASLLEAT